MGGGREEESAGAGAGGEKTGAAEEVAGDARGPVVPPKGAGTCERGQLFSAAHPAGAEWAVNNGVLDSTKPMAPVDPIIPSAPTMPDADNKKNASGNVDSFGRFQASAPSQTAVDTQCSLPSYEEAINGI